jgi:hypothetical protein
MQSIISNLKCNITSLELMVAESSVDSITIADKVSKALEIITMQQSTINDQSSTNSLLNTQLIIANAAVTSLNGIKEELESDIAYLADLQKYSSLVANKLKIEITSLRAQLHASPPPSSSASSSSSQSIASSLPPSSFVASIIIPARRKRTIGEINAACRKRTIGKIYEPIVHNDDDDHHSRLQLHIPISFVPEVFLIDLTGSTRQFSSSSSYSLPPSSFSSSSSSSSSSSPSNGTKNVANETDRSNQKPRKIPAASITQLPSQRR